MDAWLSFADESGSLGVAIIPNISADPADKRGFVLEAVDRAWKLKINPGGEVLCYPIPPGHPGPRNVLLTPDEAREIADAPQEEDFA